MHPSSFLSSSSKELCDGDDGNGDGEEDKTTFLMKDLLNTSEDTGSICFEHVTLASTQQENCSLRFKEIWERVNIVAPYKIERGKEIFCGTP